MYIWINYYESIETLKTLSSTVLDCLGEMIEQGAGRVHVVYVVTFF